MLLITDLNDIPDISEPCGLTIGSFDGVHLGHQALLTHLRSELPRSSVLAVFTFSNHPSHLFSPNSPVPLIYPPLQRVKYLHDFGVELVILVPFDAAFAKTPYDQFLTALKERLDFTQLTLGTGATFGKGREGNDANVKRLGQKLDFKVDYLPKFLLDSVPVSSGRIRALISEAKFLEAQACLGRPYSLMGHIHEDCIQTHNLCLPPDGTYPVSMKIADHIHLGKAEIDRKEQKFTLEFLDPSLRHTDQDVEIFFS